MLAHEKSLIGATAIGNNELVLQNTPTLNRNLHPNQYDDHSNDQHYLIEGGFSMSKMPGSTFPQTYKRRNYQRGSCELNKLEEKSAVDESVFSLSEILVDQTTLVMAPQDKYIHHQEKIGIEDEHSEKHYLEQSDRNPLLMDLE